MDWNLWNDTDTVGEAISEKFPASKVRLLPDDAVKEKLRMTNDLMNPNTSGLARGLLWLSGGIRDDGTIAVDDQVIGDYLSLKAGYPLEGDRLMNVLNRLEKNQIVTPAQRVRLEEKSASEIQTQLMERFELKRKETAFFKKIEESVGKLKQVKNPSYRPETTFERGAILPY